MSLSARTLNNEKIFPFLFPSLTVDYFKRSMTQLVCVHVLVYARVDTRVCTKTKRQNSISRSTPRARNNVCAPLALLWRIHDRVAFTLFHSAARIISFLAFFWCNDLDLPLADEMHDGKILRNVNELWIYDLQ